jgi:hypothetical protein
MSAELALVVERQVTNLYDSVRSKFADSKLTPMEGYLLAMEVVGGITQIHAKMVAEGKPADAVRAACHAAIDRWVVPTIHREFDRAYDHFIIGKLKADEIIQNQE